MTDRTTSFTRDGLTFDLIDSGPTDGTPVVLLHGFPQRAAIWSGVAERLHTAGMRTYAPDQRGYSPSARPSGRASYTVANLVDDVVALYDVIGRPAHLVGHDWGATVAWAVAARHPERVSTLTALSVGHPAAFLRALRGSQMRKSYYMALFQLPAIPERLMSSGWGRRFLTQAGMDSGQLEAYQRDIVDYGALTGGLMWYRALPSSAREPATKVRVPTTLVWSNRDPALGRAQAADSEKYVDAPYEFVELDGVSHWIPQHAPGAVAEAIVNRVRSV